MNNKITTIMNVNEKEIRVMRIDNEDYISLTDLARYADNEEPRLPIRDWMRNKEVISFLGLQETINNENFKGGEFATFKNEAGSNKFKMSPQKWIRETSAIGIISKSGRYDGGTFAHHDIAFEFASWLSPEFKLYLITEFQRLKVNEQKELEWSAKRELAKVNYRIHTDAIKENIVPNLSEKQLAFVYANEADVLNMALFGKTAKDWRTENPDKKGNIRDYATIEQLLVIANMESFNAILIEQGVPQRERLIQLNAMAKSQLRVLENQNTLKLLKEQLFVPMRCKKSQYNSLPILIFIIYYRSRKI